MSGNIVRPIATIDIQPPTLIGLAKLAKMAFRGVDLDPIRQSLIARGLRDPADAAAYMDLSLLELFQGREQGRALLQERALKLHSLYRHEPTRAAAPLRVLAFAAPGNLMANTPIEFLVENADIILDVLYLRPGAPLPEIVPQHDIAFVAVAEADENRAMLDLLAEGIATWPRPVLNLPHRISGLTRDAASALLAPIEGVNMPVNRRVDRTDLVGFASGAQVSGAIPGALSFPMIARPVGSHAGEGLEKLDDRTAVQSYLARHAQSEFFIAPFIDYRSEDGLFRKYRLALIDGEAYACHLAISSHWMIHYLNADMINNDQNRAEEANFMRDFESDFGARHQTALREIARRSGLDYLIMDCSETREGELLIFEVGTAMIVHAMDPEHIFPYKAAQMAKLFGAFQAMLRKRAQSANVEGAAAKIRGMQ
jgi:hypothetical protein